MYLQAIHMQPRMGMVLASLAPLVPTATRLLNCFALQAFLFATISSRASVQTAGFQ